MSNSKQFYDFFSLVNGKKEYHHEIRKRLTGFKKKIKASRSNQKRLKESEKER